MRYLSWCHCWTIPVLVCGLLLTRVSLGQQPTRSSGEGVAASPSNPGGLALSVTGGLNVAHPFVGAELGWRFERALFLEVFIDYSYGWPISVFPFHTGGVGVRTRFASRAGFGVFHEALLALAISGGGTVDVPRRDLGQRLLGAFVAQGLGAEYTLDGDWTAAVVVTTGYPVWLRPELAVRYSF